MPLRQLTRQSKGLTSRAPDGQYEKKCNCLQHEEFSAEATDRDRFLSCKANERRKPYQKLIQMQLLPPTSKWICRSCLDYSKTHFIKRPSRLSSVWKANVADGSCDELESDENTNSDLMENSNDIDADETKSDNDKDADETKDHEDTDEATDNQHKDETNAATNLTEQLDKILNQLKEIPRVWQAFNSDQQNQLANIAHIIGTIIEKDLYTDSLNVTKESNITDFDINKEEWLTKRNGLLVAFLTGCTKTKVANQEEKKMNSLIHSVEQVLNTRNLQTVSPFAFQRNLVQYTVTGSKLGTNLLGSWEPAGSYTKVETYLNSPADPPIIPAGDVHLAVDNEQRVGKSSGRIREGSSIRLDICTTMSCLQTEKGGQLQQNEDLKGGQLQQNEDLKPGKWQKRKPTEQIMNDVEAEENTSMRLFRQYRHDFIQEVLNEVKTELDTDMKDHIDTAIIQREKGLDNYVCSKCKFVNSDTGVCANCKYDPNQYPMGYDVYHRVSSKHPDQPPNIMIAEPCLVNPNTKQNVQKVMEHVQEHCKMGDNSDRKWTYVWCDAVPYLLGCKVQEDVLKCALCGEKVDKKSMKSHQEVNHKDEEMEFQEWFGDIFLRPGPGHIDLNMARAIMKLLWDPFLQHFTILLGFRSPRAQDIIHNGIDHHRNRQIIMTLLNGMAKELIRPFVIEQHANGDDATNVDKYFEWFNAVQDHNSIFAWQVCFTFLLSFQVYTESVRKNNHKFMMASRVAFAPLFYGRNHPRYRELHLRDMLDRVQCPRPLQKDIAANESFSASGMHNTGQGADFLHEEVNRTVKSLLPPGAVTASTWTRVCRKGNALSDMKERCVKSAGLKATRGRKRPKKHDHEETMFRRELRLAGLFDSPKRQKTGMKSITGSELDIDLPNMVHTLRNSYKQYKEDYMTRGQFGGGVRITKSLYITPQERQHGEAIENQTKDAIKTEISRLIREYSLSQYEKRQLKKSATKGEYLEFYYNVLEAVEEEVAERMSAAMDEEEE